MNCLTTAWSQHQRELGNWSRHKLRNQADVDDFLQSCFWKSCARVTGSAPFRTLAPGYSRWHAMPWLVK